MNSKSRFSRPRAQYKCRNWKVYNENLKKRGNIQVWFSDYVLEQWGKPEKIPRGAPRAYSSIVIQVCLTIRQIFRLPFRQTEGFLESVFEMKGIKEDIPNYTTFCRRQAGLKIDLCRKTRRSRKIIMLVDSTGLKVFGEGEWKVRQHGYSKHRTWQKLHIGVDAETQEIMTVALTTNACHDSEVVPDLLSQLKVIPQKVIGDGAYDTWKVYEALDEKGIDSVIPPKKTSKIKQHGNSGKPLLRRDENIRGIRKNGRKGWKKKSGYHQRSKVETAMYRYKKTFGDDLKARKFENQETEVKIGCAILNKFKQL
jgi:Transposase DDE domain